MNRSQPVHEVQLGHVLARIWNDSDTDDAKYSVTVHRLEKVNGHWMPNERFGVDDLPVVSEVLDMAHLWICEQSMALA